MESLIAFVPSIEFQAHQRFVTKVYAKDDEQAS